ncbi:predicted protein [Naegleria gruberi]|uniref:Predicted protein n=1 Tax=Naegleria gruberi TaxID=5762 RepID=D2VVJ3_NAEGR|nr:uncharacterized protein NAEGRDRAFT_73039 [Naegleria gruberi]EFC39045.1 predicted protein [Naegleria gruberi]|eukprot:XP_002671789.1 predicted protein [Naegleria gruberi strain NEG-M]
MSLGVKVMNFIQPSHYELSITLSDDFFSEKTNGSDISYSASLTIHCNIVNDEDDNYILPSIELDCNSDRIEIFGVSIEKNKNKLKGTLFEQNKKPISTSSNSSSSKNEQKKKKNDKSCNHNHNNNNSEISSNKKGLIIKSPIEPFTLGKYEIKISFKGIIVPSKKAMSGLFYSIHSKNSSKIICSHFEAHFAHYAFPCFDDWTQKATFQLGISNLNSNYKCISNMSVKMKNDSKKTVMFNTSPKMSIYLLGIFIGQFECLETSYISKKDEDETEFPISVYYLESGSSLIVDNSKTILEMSCKILPLLEDYFDQSILKQNISKLDWIIVPELIIGGGMENWSCITLLEKHTANTSMDMKKLGPFVEILAHELSHFWVGNLVGFPFHIKEGLAMYLEKIITDQVLKRANSITIKKNDKKNNNTSIISEIKSASNNDANLSVEQMFQKMFTGVAYTQCFDFICNECVGTLGPTVFRDRLRQVISDNEFGFVNEDDFVQSFK